MTGNPLTAFNPSSEITDPHQFAGRSDELDTLGKALQSPGAQIVIYGNRGVGKSSLAHQLDLLSRGNQEVASRLSIAPIEPFDFLTVIFRCDDSINSIPKLLARILADENCLAPWVPFRVVERDSDRSTDGRVDLKIVSLGGKKGTSIKERSEEVEQDVFGVFANALTEITKTGVTKHGVLIIVDEFDRVVDRRGLASLLKTLSSTPVKFALVGVSTNIQELITEHESVARQLADGVVNVPPMGDSDLREIINLAERHIDSRITFSEEARDWMVSIARGHPFYVHLVGKHALLKALGQKSSRVDLNIAEQAMSDIALKGSAPIQESLYKTAIGHSYVREVILKGLAGVREEEIHTTELYANLAKELKIDPGAISVYVGHLASDKYGGVIEKTRDRYYCFKDSLFKAYAAARPYQLSREDMEDD